VIQKQKEYSQLKIIEQKYGKEPSVKSDEKIVTYLNRKGYSSLSKLIEAK